MSEGQEKIRGSLFSEEGKVVHHMLTFFFNVKLLLSAPAFISVWIEALFLLLFFLIIFQYMFNFKGWPVNARPCPHVSSLKPSDKMTQDLSYVYVFLAPLWVSFLHLSRNNLDYCSDNGLYTSQRK